MHYLEAIRIKMIKERCKQVEKNNSTCDRSTNASIVHLALSEDVPVQSVVSTD